MGKSLGIVCASSDEVNSFENLESSSLVFQVFWVSQHYDLYISKSDFDVHSTSLIDRKR